MDKKNEPNIKVRPDAAQRYYDLKSSAMDDLLSAKPGKKSYSMEELGKYRNQKGLHLPEWLKVVLLKAWFAGAVCFFFLWGLGMYIPSLLDMMFVLGVALGMTYDLLLNPLLRFMEKRPGDNNRWMMLPKKSFASFVGNIVYAFVILFCVYTSYTGFNAAWASITAQPDTVALGVEPFLFGILCLGYDLLFVGMRNMFRRVVRDARDKVEGKK